MAVPYANCFQLSKVNPKCHPFSSSNRLSTRVSPVYSCLKTPGPTLHLEAKTLAGVYRCSGCGDR